MPSLKFHCALSEERTGSDFKKLHEWIDYYKRKLGFNHRTKRHAFNAKEAKQIKDFWNKKKGIGWGDKAVVEWLFHIAVDNLETAFKKAGKAYSKRNIYNFFKFGFTQNSKFIHFDFNKKNKWQLKKEFKDVYECDDYDDEDFW